MKMKQETRFILEDKKIRNRYCFYAVYSWWEEGKDTPDMVKIHSG